MSFVWSAVPVIKRFSKGQNVSILTILHVHRIWLRTILVDTHVPQKVLDIIQSGFAVRNGTRLDVV